MIKKNSVILRADQRFKEMLKEINLERIKQGKSKEMLSQRRLTLAMTRIPNLKEFMIKSEIKNDKKLKGGIK